jgi:effector-binding domain-containing protein
MPYQCEAKVQPVQPTLAIRTKTTVQDLPQWLRKAYGAIAQYLGELGEYPAGPPFAGYHNMDMQALDVEAGFPISKTLPGKGEIQASEIPGGMIARCLHEGPYETMAPAYAALSQWIQAQGYETTGVAYEMYLTDPSQTPPQEMRTLILFPLKT